MNNKFIIVHKYKYAASPERIWKWSEGTRPAKSAGTFFGHVPPLILALQVKLVSSFVMVSIVWSVSCLLGLNILILMVPPVPSHL